MQIKKALSRVSSWVWVISLGGLLIGGVFLYSIKTYLASTIGQEVSVAEVTVADLVRPPIELKDFKKSGKLRVSTFVLGNPIKFIFTYKTRTYVYIVPPNSYKDTEFSVDPSDTVKVFLSAENTINTIMYGYVPPEGTTCGLKPYEQYDVTEYVNVVKGYGEDIIDIQCWNEEESDPNPLQDYNDSLIVWSYAPDAVASPSPSPVASPSPSPVASPSPSPVASPSPDISPSPSVSPSPSPSGYVSPTQPDTGTPTWLTLSLILGILGLLSVKLKLGDEA